MLGQLEVSWNHDASSKAPEFWVVFLPMPSDRGLGGSNPEIKEVLGWQALESLLESDLHLDRRMVGECLQALRDAGECHLDSLNVDESVASHLWPNTLIRHDVVPRLRRH
jgi:hypothetical protein